MKSKIMKMMVAALVLASFGLMGCDTTVKDADGNSYPTVKIGNQVWMAKNLNVNVPGSMCYENDPANCEKYGRLYTWKAAMKACPIGWHLPSKEEFETLLINVGFSGKERGENLRAASWENGADKFGFSALPAGSYYYDEFGHLGIRTYFWSSPEYSSGYPYRLDINDYSALVVSYSGYDGHSVRCLQDSN